ncbi:MAG TPA: bile acid:sodium symporter family protein [Opitutaceae bacterium]|nr:bile acid:sodium symporter family protein [Opitutaceae bacterium]
MTGLRRNWFLVGLVAAVGLAWVFPDAGARGGFLHTEITIRVAVALIFFSQGLTLALDALRHGALHWRLHVLVQAWNFGLFPLVGLLLDRLAGGILPPDLRTGFLFLCVLPTTLSTAIVFTALAGGNAAGAIFNATLSNLLGIAVTPLWTGWLMRAGGRTLPLVPVIFEIVLLLLVPLAAGQVLRPWLRRWVDPRKARLTNANSAIVLFIVYAAFAQSVAARVWERSGAQSVLLAAAGVTLLFAFVMAAVRLTIRAVRLEGGDTSAALFCASQKTLAAGVPMAQLIFGAHPGLGLILLPVMLYHPLQLLVHGMIAVRWRGSQAL